MYGICAISPSNSAYSLCYHVVTEYAQPMASVSLLQPPSIAGQSRRWARQSGTSGHVMVGNAPRVLIVDDDVPICELLELAFTDEGWDVRVRTRGQHALDLLRRWTADVILLDLRMPEMDGETFLARCRGAMRQEIPVLLFSASSNLDHHAARLGVRAVVAKPFDIDVLCT